MVASHMREALSDDVTPAFESLFRELAREERIALEHCFLHFDLSNKHNAELSAKAALTNKATDTAPPQSAEVPTAQPNETTPTIAEPPYDQAAVNHYLTLRTQLLERAQLDPQKVAYQNAFDNAVKASGNAFVRGEYTG